MSLGGGVLSLAEVDKGAQQERMIGGSGMISKGLAEIVEKGGNRVLLNHVVTEIDQTDKRVKVTTQNGKQFECKYLILAIPPTQTLRIKFTPPLPHTREQLASRVYMGSFVKYVVVYDKCFWREKQFSGNIIFQIDINV